MAGAAVLEEQGEGLDPGCHAARAEPKGPEWKRVLQMRGFQCSAVCKTVSRQSKDPKWEIVLPLWTPGPQDPCQGGSCYQFFMILPEENLYKCCYCCHIKKEYCEKQEIKCFFPVSPGVVVMELERGVAVGRRKPQRLTSLLSAPLPQYLSCPWP